MANLLVRTPLLFLLPLRLSCGYLLLATGMGKVLSGWLTSPLLALRIHEWLSAGHIPPAAVPAVEPLLRHMGHHAQLYSRLVAGGEVLCGAALFVGLFSRYAAFAGLLLLLLPFVASGEGLGPGPELVVCATLVTLTFAGGGQVLGLDALLRGRVPPWLA